MLLKLSEQTVSINNIFGVLGSAFVGEADSDFGALVRCAVEGDGTFVAIDAGFDDG